MTCVWLSPKALHVSGGIRRPTTPPPTLSTLSPTSPCLNPNRQVWPTECQRQSKDLPVVMQVNNAVECKLEVVADKIRPSHEQ